jgi:hypothetical protein
MKSFVSIKQNTKKIILNIDSFCLFILKFYFDIVNDFAIFCFFKDFHNGGLFYTEV